ncbi:MAG: hypothetical protein IMX04_07700 [Candidatus Carbobacillus altaicus]|nr:hypothetical protein [Candidatus Carbobacillus altaicus]
MLMRIKSALLVMLIAISVVLSAFLWVVPPPLNDGESTRYKTPITFGKTLQLTDLIIPEKIIVKNKDGYMAILDPAYLEPFWREQLAGTLREIIANMREMSERISEDTVQERYVVFFSKGVDLSYMMEQADTKQEDLRGMLEQIELIKVEGDLEKGILVHITFEDGRHWEGWAGDERRALWLKLVPPLSRWIALTPFSSLSSAAVSDHPPLPDTVDSENSRPEEDMNMENKQFMDDRAWSNELLPEKPPELPVYVDRFVPISTDDAAEALFLDLSTMRQVKERDGAHIFSDGVRSLKVRGDARLMRYFSPPLPQGREIGEAVDTLTRAVAFVNRHAGWNGDERLIARTIREQGEQVVFQSVVDGYPLYADGEALPYYTLQVELKGEDVIAYERTLWRRISRDGDGRVQLMTLDELQETLRSRMENPTVVRVTISYRTALTKTAGVIRLVPGYAVALADGENFFFPGETVDEAAP